MIQGEGAAEQFRTMRQLSLAQILFVSKREEGSGAAFPPD